MLFIFDYQGRIVGNPKGYRTTRGCNIALNSKCSVQGKKWVKLKYYLWDIHQTAMDNGHTGTMIYQTKYISK